MADNGDGRSQTVAARVSIDMQNRLRWVAYRHSTTMSAILYTYLEEGLRREDFTGYAPPAETTRS